MTQPLNIEKKDIDAYVVLRARVMDFIHLTLLWDAVNQGIDPLARYPTHGPEQLADTLRTASIGWLASLIDPNSSAVNAFRIWPKIFPHRLSDIKRVEASLEPCQKALQDFRNNVAFHSNKNKKRYLKVRAALRSTNLGEVSDQFLELASSLLEEESKDLNLIQAVEMATKDG